MNVEETVREYYETLRREEPLHPSFLEGSSTTKFGVSESLFGYEAVEEALREQTETTADWSVESHNLTVDERDDSAVFADEVTLAWTDTQTGERWRFETRWSGSLERSDSETDDEDWKFRTIHVSAPQDL